MCVRHVRWVGLWLALCLLSGCATSAARREGLDYSKAAAQLAKALVNLDPSIDSAEADRVAQRAFVSSGELARSYRAVWPAGFHNFLVNRGARPRGLCWHWADDLEARLAELNPRTLELHRAVARLGRSGEHSAVVLTARGQEFSDGIVLDAWRHGGRLHWASVKDDRFFYPWIRVRVIAGP